MTKQLALFTMMMIAAPAARADDSGLASIHDWKNERGNRVCMADHYHEGGGKGKTRQDAEAAAKSSWTSFTIFEYGTDWGSYRLAASPTMTCSNAAPNSWSCSTSARPCKRHSGARMAKAARAPRSASR